MTSFMFWTYQETEDPGGQVVKKDNDREHKVFKVKSYTKLRWHMRIAVSMWWICFWGHYSVWGKLTFVVLSNFPFKPNIHL